MVKVERYRSKRERRDMGSWIKASAAGHKHSPLPSLVWMVMEEGPPSVPATKS